MRATVFTVLAAMAVAAGLGAPQPAPAQDEGYAYYRREYGPERGNAVVMCEVDDRGRGRDCAVIAGADRLTAEQKAAVLAESEGALLPPPAAASRSVAASLDELGPFLGEWNHQPAACGTGDSDTLMVIARDSVAFYESMGPITKITAHGPREITIESDPAVGEDSDARWSGSVRVRLSDDGRMLEQLTDAEPVVLHRCPA